jgi:hypothetical protein
MAELPEIVRQRLKQEAGEHPDAGLLTAFAENSLLKREREQVLEHLSQCAACREVVSLALPEVEPPIAAATPARTARLRWPLLRWAALASAAAVVAIAVFVSFEPNLLRSRMATVPAARQVEAPVPAAPPVAGEKTAHKKEAEHAAEAAAAPAGAPAEPQTGKASVPEVAAAAPVPPSSKKLEGMAAAELKQAPAAADKFSVARTEAAEMAAKDEITGAAKTEPAAKLLRAKPGTPGRPESAEVLAKGETESRNAAVAAGAAGGLRTAAATATWRISDAGKLQRSADGGMSWRTVPVDDAVFRAVSMVGNDIWAGGAGGALYHSADGGGEWARVTPAANGERLTADIVHIEFSDARHGAVVTASGESWITQDGGRTWSRR